MRSVNLGIDYDRELGSYARILKGQHRWIGRCKKCGATHQVNGEAVYMHAPAQRPQVGALTGSARPSRVDVVIRTPEGMLYTAGDRAGIGSHWGNVMVPCGDHWKTLELVTEGTKKSKHECGARCTNATGPNCDCKCRGKNHGSNC